LDSFKFVDLDGKKLFSNHTITMKNQVQKKSLVTVLMSVYNGQKYLREAVDSILNQTHRNIEFIIINDASTDNTRIILESYNDPRIILLHNKLNLGLTKSLNLGLDIAKGEYVARMDADDISLPERIRTQRGYLDSHPNIILASSRTIVIDRDGVKIGRKNPPSNPEFLKFLMMTKNQMTHSSVMFRKSIILEHGGYNEKIKYTQDYEL